MAEIQEFCLKWNNYQSNLASAFLDLKRGEDFVDVTLACDGRSVQAHRVVLSACSPFFRDLLKATPCKHPIVVLKDVSFGDLVALLEFMYQGEVKVVQDGLSSFLRTAEVLKIKGLTEDSSNQKRPRQDSENASSPTYRGKSWLKTDRQGPTPPPALAQNSFTGLPPPSMSIVPQPQSLCSSDSSCLEKHLRLSSSIAVTKKSRLIPEHGDNANQPSSAPSPSSWQPERESSVISHNPNHFNPITVRSKAEMIELETSSGSECVEKEDEDQNHPTSQLDTQMPISMTESTEDSFRMISSGSQPEIHESMELGNIPGVPLSRIPESHMSHMLGPYQSSVDPLATGIRDVAANGYAGESGESGGGGGGTVVDAPIPHLSNMDMVLAAGGVGGCGTSRFSHRKQPFTLPPLSLPGVSFHSGDVLDPSVNLHTRAADLSPLPIDNPATPFQCPICRRYYTSYASVKRHIRDSHPLTDEVYPCNICGRSYGSRNSLATHRSTKHRDCTRKHKTMEWPGHMGSLEIADSLELGPAKLEDDDIDLDRSYPGDIVFGGQNGAQNHI